MDIRPALKSQYHAAMQTLRLCIEACPDAMWADPKDGYAAFWRGVYHTLFFTHFYLDDDHESFVRWDKHQEEAEDLGPFNGPNGQVPKAARPYTKEELLSYWLLVDGKIDGRVDGMDLESPASGFPWYGPMGKLEHQLVNLRHIQHHAAALSMRLRLGADIEVRWVGRAR